MTKSCWFFTFLHSFCFPPGMVVGFNSSGFPTFLTFSLEAKYARVFLPTSKFNGHGSTFFLNLRRLEFPPWQALLGFSRSAEMHRIPKKGQKCQIQLSRVELASKIKTGTRPLLDQISRVFWKTGIAPWNPGIVPWKPGIMPKNPELQLDLTEN